jgi:hypothetical protein
MILDFFLRFQGLGPRGRSKREEGKSGVRKRKLRRGNRREEIEKRK